MAEKLPITPGDAALLLCEALYVTGTLETACIGDKQDCEPLPRGMLSCGEAWRLVPLVVALLIDRFPELADEEYFLNALQNAKLQSAIGMVN